MWIECSSSTIPRRSKARPCFGGRMPGETRSHVNSGELQFISAGTMQSERRERGIYFAEASTFHQRSRAFPCLRGLTSFRVSEAPFEIHGSRLASPRFYGLKSTPRLHRSGSAISPRRYSLLGWVDSLLRPHEGRAGGEGWGEGWGEGLVRQEDRGNLLSPALSSILMVERENGYVSPLLVPEDLQDFEMQPVFQRHEFHLQRN